MRNVVFRKMYMSIFAMLLVLITSIATTFAWVGMLSTATFGGFTMNLKIEDYDNPYYLTISSIDGIKNSDFGNSTAQIDIQKQILKNMGINYSIIDLDNLNDPNEVNKLFRRDAMLTPVTTDDNLSEFYEMTNLGRKITDLYPSKAYYKFDIYLSVDAVAGIQDTTEINANVFFDNIVNCLDGTLSTSTLINGNPFLSSSYIPSTTYDPFNLLPSINPNKVVVDSKSAARFAFAIYDPIPLTESYNGLVPSYFKIYQGGTKTPTIFNDVYSFGGILPEEYNLAIQEIDSIYNINLKLDNVHVNGETVPYVNYGSKNRIVNNTDLELLEENKTLWSKPSTIVGTNYLGVHKDTSTNKSIQTKLKMTIYFWFEGFDADCFQGIDYKNVDLSIIFATDKEA